MRKLSLITILLLLLVPGCGKDEPERPPSASSDAPKEGGELFSMESLASGARLYQEHCATCHGPEAQGHPDWERSSRTDLPAAPPLNGSGNDSKRKKQELVAAIKNGTMRKGMSLMPAWKGRLSDQEIEDIIVWFQALWPTDVYDRWRKANATDASPRG